MTHGKMKTSGTSAEYWSLWRRKKPNHWEWLYTGPHWRIELATSNSSFCNPKYEHLILPPGELPVGDGPDKCHVGFKVG